MVQNENSNDSSATESPVRQNPAKGIPCGKYRLVGWGIDTTGRRLIDEIFQIATYLPKAQHSQYIMPFGFLNPYFKRRHQIAIINTDRYRMLRNTKTNKYVKTKSEISALTDFIKWLEDNRGEEVDGIVLVYHEVHKTCPGMLLEALKRCNLLERFGNVVKGFTNVFDIAQAKCTNTTKSFNLRVLARVLLNKDEEDFSSAVDRAKAAFDITVHLAQEERLNLEGKAALDNSGTEAFVIETVCPFTNPISAEEDEIAQLKVILERQNTFRPVFGALLKASRVERQHASHLRKLLAENNINYEKLKAAYESGAKEGLDKVLKAEVANAKEKDLDELLEILDCFFDPDKKAVRPKPRYLNNNRRPFNRRKSFSNKNRSNSESTQNASSDNATASGSNEATPRSEADKVEIKAEIKTEIKSEAEDTKTPAPAVGEDVQQEAVAVQ